jgi:hypothetical protein
MPGKTAVPAKKITLPVLTPDQLKQISEFVLREAAAGEVRSTLNVGSYLFAQVYRSSEEAFRANDPHKSDSLRDLAEQPGMAEAEWGRTRLENAIKLFLMSKAHNDFRAWRFLRVSHYEVVFGLPADKQRALLDQADKGHWSVIRLGEEAGKLRPRAAKPASDAVSPERAMSRLRKVETAIAPLAAPATSVDTFLVPAGVDAEKAAKFTALMEEGAEVLESIRADL